MTKADAFYHYRNQKVGICNLTCREREDMSWVIKHFGLDACEREYRKETIEKSNEFHKDELEYLCFLAK